MPLRPGPRGSGKPASLYAMLVRLGVERQSVVNISTIEDPIEYTLPRVRQMAVNPSAGVEFAPGVRAVRLPAPAPSPPPPRPPTAARACVPRLLDMGIEPFLVASTLALALAQRL